MSLFDFLKSPAQRERARERKLLEAAAPARAKLECDLCGMNGDGPKWLAQHRQEHLDTLVDTRADGSEQPPYREGQGKAGQTVIYRVHACRYVTPLTIYENKSLWRFAAKVAREFPPEADIQYVPERYHVWPNERTGMSRGELISMLVIIRF